MRKLRVLYLKQDGAVPLWHEVTTSLISERHDISTFDPKKALLEQFSGVDAVVDMGGASATEELIAVATQAKLWQIVTVGYDFFESRIEVLRKAGIPVCHCPGTTSSLGLAESAVMFMLMIVHRYNESQEVLRRGEVHTPLGEELEGKVLGLIGFGASGQELARLTKKFGMKLMIIEPMDINSATLEDYRPEFVGKPEEIDHVFRKADFVSLHLPLSPETQGVIDKRKIGLMKPTASLINTARGDLVDQDALYQALLNNRITGIGTDVHCGTYPQPQHPVYQHPNFYALPHVAGTTKGTIRRRAEICLENLDRLAAGKKLKYRID